MRKSLIALGITSLLASVTAHADTVFGLYAGVNAWNMATSGGFAESSNTIDFNFADENTGNFYIALEHPLPLIPNLKLSRTNMDNSGKVQLSENFTFGGEIFAATSNVTTTNELTSTDMILYYELFDNDLISFDFGINAKYIDGLLVVSETADTSADGGGREEFSGIVPMLYSRLALGLPLTGWSVYIEGSYLSIDDSTLNDYQAAVAYSLLDNSALDMNVQLGYRSMSLDLNDVDNIYSNLTFKGVFAGVEVHF
jgi:outer membrane protein